MFFNGCAVSVKNSDTHRGPEYITVVNYNCGTIFVFSIKKETSVDFDMKKSISRTSFVGKDSAV